VIKIHEKTENLQNKSRVHIKERDTKEVSIQSRCLYPVNRVILHTVKIGFSFLSTLNRVPLEATMPSSKTYVVSRDMPSQEKKETRGARHVKCTAAFRVMILME
jgi:hypothetical protein